MLLLLLLCAPAAAVGPAHLTKDIRPGLGSFDPDLEDDVFYGYAPTTGGVVFLSFQGWGDSLECALWVTDGAGRAERLADLCALSPTLNLDSLSMLGGNGSVALFTNAAGRLWRTDGTAAGTFALADAEPSSFQVATLGPDGRTLFFSACADGTGCEPWVSDGTRAGTRLLLDATPGSDNSSPGNFTSYGDRVLFTTEGGLWSTDGTPQGTVQLMATPEPAGAPVFFGGKIYFASTAVGSGSYDDVWVYAPATGESLLLKRFRSSSFPFSTAVTVTGGRVLIRHDDDSSGSSLWETDGTVEGTRPVGSATTFAWTTAILDVRGGAVFAAERKGGVDLRLFSLPLGARRPTLLKGCPDGCPKPALNTLDNGTVLNGSLYFEGCLPPTRGRGVWVTDGTARGTRQVKELSSEDCDNDALSFRVALGRVVFLDEKGALWTTDGTEAGTVRLARTGELPSPYFPPDLAVWKSRVFFTGVDPRRGPQPFVSDLTPGGTGPAGHIGGIRGASSEAAGLASLGGRALFAACDGREEGIWTSDGTPGGTFQLPGTATGAPCGEPPAVAFIRVGDLAFFAWKDQLWRTDGTARGTVAFAGLPAGSLAAGAELGGRLLFAAGPPAPGDGSGVTWTFWTSDGTPGGTRQAFTFHLGAPPEQMTTAGGLVYFRASDGVHYGISLWRTDGTAAGTFPILGDDGGPLQIVRFRGRTWLIANNREIEDDALRATDGTAAGTVPVTAALPYGLVVFQGSLCYFSGYPLGLWCSDGTAAGSHLVKELPGLFADEMPPELTVVGNRMFFRLNDGVHGAELWASDGTEAGTGLVKDIVPGAAGSRPDELTAAGGRLWFAAVDREHGRELWTSDGTPAGTRRVQDLFPGLPSSAPGQLTPAAGTLYFTADDGTHGREPWALPLSP